MRLPRDYIALKIDTDSHGLTILVSLAAPNTRVFFFQIRHVLEAFFLNA